MCMVMVRCQITSSAHTFLLFVLLSLSSKLTDCTPINPNREAVSGQNGPLSSGITHLLLGEDKKGPNKEEEEEDELFKDVDPKTLAAVLLEALNKPQRERNGEEAEGLGQERSTEEEQEVKRGQERSREEEQELQAVDRDRDGRQELELVMAAAAAQGREEREREEEEERKKAVEEEERLTEKVASHTTSQTVPLKAKPAEEEGQKEEPVKFGEGLEGDEEEQLSPEEVKNLQNMLEEFQSYSAGTTENHSAEKTGQRESRGHLSDPDNDYPDNDIRPKGFRGYNLGLSKKKLKWKQQQDVEQPKAKNRPTYRGGNFMDDFDNNQSEPAEEEEGEEEEEVMSPEEEEARAKAEQEEVRRQAAEAQRAKAEEEKLADIASDMLLQYMMKQDGKKSQEQRKKNVLGMNAAEDKRSDEEEDMDDDDIDPQTIDKLIEISSKLHLPADDVVDIISDVEKKKKKDAPETLTWQRPLLSPPATAPVAPAPRFPAPAKQTPAISSSFKPWFKDRAIINPNKQDFWLQPQKQPFRAYSPYPYYQKTYPGYYPIYFPPPKPKARYYAKPSYAFNTLLGNSLDYDFDFTPKRRYRAWAQPRLRTPPTLQRNLYFPNYIVPHPRAFAAVPMPKPRSPPRHRSAFYYPPPVPLVTRGQDYYGQRTPSEQDSDEELENFIEKVFLKRPRMFQ